MAYALRYYKEIPQGNGNVIRLEIHKKDSTAGAIEIGAVVQGLSLQIQGSQGDIDTPIVKTSLSMTFVDASDLENGKKNGFWEEFYTPDSVLWKVIVKARNATETAFTTIWGGYVTPDSFSETLSYRGSVNIIARDNIGHMQDFSFDAEGDADGMISLRELIEGAWAKIDSPMSLIIATPQMLQTEGANAADTLMNVSAFEDMNWYEAVENALYSYGMVMRWVGDNEVQVASLRYMPHLGYVTADDVPHCNPIFMVGATRELVPAARMVEETVKYDLVDDIPQEQVAEDDFTGEGTYTCKVDGIDLGNGSFGTSSHSAPVWKISGAGAWSSNDSTTLFFNPHAYEVGYFSEKRGLGDEMRKYMYIAANNTDTRQVSFMRKINCADFDIKFKFGQPCVLDKQGKLEQKAIYNLKSITYRIRLRQNGITNYYAKAGSWSVDAKTITYTFDATQQNFEFAQFVTAGEYLGGAELFVDILNIEYVQTTAGGGTGLYACLQELTLSKAKSTALLEKNTVKSIYNEGNNVILSRDPKLGAAFNYVALPQFINNGIFYRDNGEILPAKAWAWQGGKPQQLAVYNHLQLLSFYAKPNNLISGTIVNADITKGLTIYEWRGVEHLLLSGNYNLLTGYIDGAMLREFARYSRQVSVHLEKSAIYVVKSGQAYDLKITCWGMIDWEITSIPAWITASRMSGSGSAEVLLTISENNSGVVRVGTIKINDTTLTITQKNRLGDFNVDFSVDYL